MTIALAPGLADRYERDVLPRLIERLDDAFPEFGWTARSAVGTVCAADEGGTAWIRSRQS